MHVGENLVGLWTNTNDKAIYFVTTWDADGQQLSGTNDDVIVFTTTSRPDAVVNACWSVILVDVPDDRVAKNPLNGFNFNSDSGLKSEADQQPCQLRQSAWWKWPRHSTKHRM